MKVKDVMTENPACCATSTGLQEVARMMLEKNCGCIPVVDMNNKPVGMITDRDITIRTVAHGKNPLGMIAGEAMSDNVITVTSETSVKDCCDAMEKSQLRRIAVVDERGCVCGIVAQADVAASASKEQTGEVIREISKENSKA